MFYKNIFILFVFINFALLSCKKEDNYVPEKYAEAIRLYGTTTETLKDIATRLGLTYNSIGGYIRRNHPEVINAHSTLLIEKDEKSVITSK